MPIDQPKPSIEEVKANLGGGNAEEEAPADTTETEGEDESPENKEDGADEDGDDSEDGDKLPDEEKEPDYKVKFSESTRENQRILSEKAVIEQERDQMKTDIEKLTKLVDEYKAVAEGANPDGAKLLKLSQEIDVLKSTTLSQKEDLAIKDFIASTPEAKPVQDSLRKLFRLNPTKSLADLWKENFAPLIEAAGKKATDTSNAKKKQKPTSGKGAISSEPIGGLPANFNELPLAERKEILKRVGH